MRVTKHAKIRLKERGGFNKRSMDRIANIALEKGIKHKEATGKLEKFFAGVYFKYKKANNIRIYGDKTYIFVDDTLVTVFQVPSYLQISVNNIMKKKRGNVENM